jgi:flagellar biosynthesis/type III secretory pathway M-ring protein FliF/YscJ
VQVTREVPTLAIGGANVEVSATALPFDGSVVVPEPFTAQSQVAGAPWSFLVLVIVVLAAAAIATVLIIRRRRENLYFAYLARERETQQAEKEGALT